MKFATTWLRSASFLHLLASAALAKPLEVVIHHRYGEAPLLMESARYETAAKETFSITRLAYLLS